MSEHEIPLPGGNLNPLVVRVGDTVRRTAGPWTTAVHELLLHLSDRSYPAPRPLGFDESGREVLTYIPGVCVHPDNMAVIATDDGLRRAGRLIADYHRAQEGFVAPTDAAWRSDGRDPTGSTEVMAHNDLAPWNLVTARSGWVFIDWDLVAPGRRMWDLAWALHSFVGLWPDSTLPDDEIGRRISAFCDGAEVEQGDRPRLLGIAVERMQHHVVTLHNKAESGDAAYQRLVSDGHADKWEKASEHVAEGSDNWVRLIGA